MKVAPEELAKGELSEFMHVRATRTSGINRKRATSALILGVGGGGGWNFFLLSNISSINFVFHNLEGREGQGKVYEIGHK